METSNYLKEQPRNPSVKAELQVRVEVASMPERSTAEWRETYLHLRIAHLQLANLYLRLQEEIDQLYDVESFRQDN